ncbi:ATP-dependent zinc protease family protein [Adhaeretor mobilis]|uniref:Retropepsin-like aspartic endopeptidase domain-containing protein n=1 Tax=Adhaeretor mobilis TaxID=1930276 RepID=A0A517MYN4_9BACT|nr:RimK/LysX family protein [Adhaeretor mobilis]QDS99976.1 hypothetical protein HG15A2_33120 [Adhaeretor mobilis]
MVRRKNGCTSAEKLLSPGAIDLEGCRNIVSNPSTLSLATVCRVSSYPCPRLQGTMFLNAPFQFLSTTSCRKLVVAACAAYSFTCLTPTISCLGAEPDSPQVLPAKTEAKPEVKPEAEAAPKKQKQVIGAIAKVEEKQSDLTFTARVDTGATTSSIHVEQWNIADSAEKMTKNLGKKIRFQIKNGDGDRKWLERKIEAISVVKTSEREEMRYKVPVTLTCNGVKKRVLVSLNDRSHMKFPVLLGRNYLEGDFLVDVELSKE